MNIVVTELNRLCSGGSLKAADCPRCHQYIAKRCEVSCCHTVIIKSPLPLWKERNIVGSGGVPWPWRKNGLLKLERGSRHIVCMSSIFPRGQSLILRDVMKRVSQDVLRFY